MIDPLSDENDIEGDLMAAMNAALQDGSDSNMGLLDGDGEDDDDDDDDDDMLSVDVVGEAMNLLMTSASNSEAGDGEIEDLDGLDQEREEEISFEDFMAGKATIDDGEDDGDGEKIETSEIPTENSNGEEPAPSRDSPDSPDDSSPTVGNDAGSGGNGNGNGNGAHEPVSSVPLQQFENALALIQDLENRVLILETDRQCLVEENAFLKEETLAQATMLTTLEAKLAEFPKLLQQTVDEEAKLAAAKAQAETKFSFWKKDMDRQEKELEEEKRKRSRNHAATTDSLQQSDFLKDIVERKEQEEKTPGGVAAVAGGLLSKVTGPLQNSQSKAQNGAATSDPADGNNNHDHNNNSKNNNNNNSNNTPQSPKRKGPFGFLRGWGGGKDKNNKNKDKDKDNTNQDGEGDAPDETTGEGSGHIRGSDDIRGSERDLATSNSHDSNGGAGGPLDGEDDANEMMTIVHDKHNPDDKMLGLLT